MAGIWLWCCLMVAVIGVWSAGAAIERRIEGRTRQPMVVAVDLDEDVFRQTQMEWGDLRVVDEEGHEVPRVVETKRKYKFEERIVEHRTELKSLRELEDGGLAVDFVVPGTNVVEFSKLVVKSGLRDFEQSVTVMVESASGEWQSVVEGELLFDYSRYADIRKTSVGLSKLTGRSYRVVVGRADDQVFSRHVSMTEERRKGGEGVSEFKRYQVEQRPFRIDAIVMQEIKRQATLAGVESTLLPVAGFSIEAARDQRVTSVIVDGEMWPLKSLVLNPVQLNFERQVRVYTSAPGGWRERGRAVISRMRLPDMVASESCEIELGDLRAEKLKIEISNDDNPPLTLTEGAISCLRLRYQVLFIAEPGRSYKLTYDNPLHQSPPVYERGVINYLRSGRKAELWSLAQEFESLAGSRLRAALLNYWKRHGMKSVSLAVMAVLGFLLWRAVRSTKP